MISGAPKRWIASSSASTQKSPSSVFEALGQTLRVNQSIIAIQIQGATPLRQVGDVGAPSLIGPVDLQTA
jgi:hypothetical protein